MRGQIVQPVACPWHDFRSVAGEEWADRQSLPVDGPAAADGDVHNALEHVGVWSRLARVGHVVASDAGRQYSDLTSVWRQRNIVHPRGIYGARGARLICALKE